MNLGNLSSILVLVLALGGCSSVPSKEKFQSVQPGWSYFEVVNYLGEPTFESQFGRQEQLHWDGQRKSNYSVLLENEKVVATPDLLKGAVNISGQSFVGGKKPLKKIAKVLPSVKGMSVSDLEFVAVKKMVESALKSHGFRFSENDSELDTIVFLNFGISEPKTTTLSWAEPVYDYEPGTSPTYPATTTHTFYNKNGLEAGRVESKNNQIDYGTSGKYVYKGQRQRSLQTTAFVRHLVVEAVDYSSYKSQKDLTFFWKTVVLSEGGSANLHRVLPYMVLATRLLVDQESDGRIETAFAVDDPRVRIFRSTNARTPASIDDSKRILRDVKVDDQ